MMIGEGIIRMRMLVRTDGLSKYIYQLEFNLLYL
jgi:hypothetical protein